MTGRKLNKHQQWRIKKIQQQRLARAKHKQQQLDHDYTVEDDNYYHGLVVSHFGMTLDIEPVGAVPQQIQAHPCHQDENNRNIIRCGVRQNLGSIVCGDQIIWQAIIHRTSETTINANNTPCPVQGIVTAVEPRRTVLAKPDFSGKMKPVAANIDQILIVTAPVPEFNEGLIDRYLLAAELSQIQAVVILNKIDTLDNEQLQSLQQRAAVYQAIGYPVILTSAVAQDGMTALYLQLEGKTSVFVGQSGVGKSSLIKSLVPEINIKIATVSSATNKGKHTTSVSRLYHLVNDKLKDARLIDSPGVREFGLWDINKEDVINGFRDFRSYSGRCKFRDCHHLNEPGCALLQAVEDGNISQQRLDSYHRILASL